MEGLEKLKAGMERGFNTYFNESVLSHVRMPEGFALSLGFKFYNQTRVLHTALIGRLGDDDEQIHPGLRTYDGRYTELTLECCGHELLVQSSVVDGEQTLLVTPLHMAEVPPALLISAAMVWKRPGYTQLSGDTLEGCWPGGGIRVFTDGELIREQGAGMVNPYLAVRLDRPVAISTGRRIGHGELEKRMAAERAALLAHDEERYGKLAEAAQAMRSCLAWDTIYEPEKEQICSPVSRLWSIRWGGYVLFCWDTFFSSMLAMTENKELAYMNAIAIVGEHTEEGFIPNFGAANDYKSRDRSQPPVGSLAVRELYRIYREPWLVEYLFDALLRWNRWFSEKRMLPNGQLCWGSSPYTPQAGRGWETEGVNCRLGAALESGLDNSPMYDDAGFDKETHLMQLADVGLTGLYIMDCEALAELAEEIGRPEATELRGRAEHSKDGLEELWDEDAGMYLNRHTDSGKFSRHISPTNFYALFSDRVSDSHAAAMMERHFYNPEEFYGPYMLPSIARNDPGYPDQDYWRGRIWAPMNFLAYLAMRKKGLWKECRILAEKSEEMLLKEWRLHGHIHENYNADTGMGCDVWNSDRFYHWGALSALIALIDAGQVEGPEKKLSGK